MRSFHDVLDGLDLDGLISRTQEATTADVRRALDRPRLELGDFATLISPAAAPCLEELAQRAHRLTLHRFGRCLQLYIPVYLANACVNSCTYCGFSAGHARTRVILDPDGIRAEAEAVAAMGFEHVLLLTGDHPDTGVDYLTEALDIMAARFANVSLEVQPLAVEDYRRLRGHGLHGVMVYQETYDRAVYARCHPGGPKADFEHRLETPDRLGAAGVHKIGIGNLIGLADWRRDACCTAAHLRHLRRTWWRSALAVSFPRLRPHAGDARPDQHMNERELVQLICAYRLFDPEVEMSLTTRESPAFRDHACRLGVTHLSAASRTEPGGYAAGNGEPTELEQFSVGDPRGAPAVAAAVRAAGYEAVWKDWDEAYNGSETAGELPKQNRRRG